MSRTLEAAIVGFWFLTGVPALGDSLLEIRSGLNSLHQVQDDIARGNSGSSQFQEVLLNRVMDGLETSPATVLAEIEYQNALAELALSGGDRKRTIKLIQLIQDNGQVVPILSAIDAYLAGQMDKASSAFEAVETSESHVTNIGHFAALAKGTALLDSDLAKARNAFEHAVLLGPGTLVEEVSLRRLVGIGIAQRDPELFVRCIAIYFRRYANSPFAAELEASFIEGVTLVESPDDIARLGYLLASLPGSAGRHLAILAANRLLSAGRIEHAARFVHQLDENKTGGGESASSGTQKRLLELLVDVKHAQATKALSFLHEIELTQEPSDIIDLSIVAKHVFWNIYKPLKVTADLSESNSVSPNDGSNDLAKIELSLARAKSVVAIAEKAKGGAL